MGGRQQWDHPTGNRLPPGQGYAERLKDFDSRNATRYKWREGEHFHTHGGTVSESTVCSASISSSRFYTAVYLWGLTFSQDAFRDSKGQQRQPLFCCANLARMIHSSVVHVTVLALLSRRLPDTRVASGDGRMVMFL